MTAVVLIGVIADRAPLTMRRIAVAALAVMLIVPEAVIHPSFQMSFAATLALIATYERGIPWIATAPETPLGARIALWGAREITVLAIASLVAGLAPTPYAAYHFHRRAPYGVIANLLAMPIISALSMPAGLLALVAMPFGFDAPLWRLMGVGIDWMVAVAVWVANLPGAVGHVPAFGVGAGLLATAGLIVVCLLRSPLRFLGAGFGVAGCGVALVGARPGARGSAGGGGGPGGGLADDCTRGIVIGSLGVGPADCAATVLNRATLRSNGAMALTYRNGQFETASARPGGIDRPWTRHREAARRAAQSVAASHALPVSRDATPPQP